MCVVRSLDYILFIIPFFLQLLNKGKKRNRFETLFFILKKNRNVRCAAVSLCVSFNLNLLSPCVPQASRPGLCLLSFFFYFFFHLVSVPIWTTEGETPWSPSIDSELIRNFRGNPSTFSAWGVPSSSPLWTFLFAFVSSHSSYPFSQSIAARLLCENYRTTSYSFSPFFAYNYFPSVFPVDYLTTVTFSCSLNDWKVGESLLTLYLTSIRWEIVSHQLELKCAWIRMISYLLLLLIFYIFIRPMFIYFTHSPTEATTTTTTIATTDGQRSV